jgi:LuxR family transcriptional regulator, maltose regulon positive regulatory protein
LAIVDQVASAWGMRQDKDGGKTAWCTLELPAQHAATIDGGSVRPPASIRTAARAIGTDGRDRGPAVAMSRLGPGLLGSKLEPPALGAGLVPRARLASLLQAGVQAKLCLLAAPAGSGKTTLLGQWRAAAGGERVAWMSLDEGDNDPLRFWSCGVEALRTIQPSLGTAALEALRGPRVDLDRVVLPGLLNDLHAVDEPLVLVLDGYHLVTDATCLHTLGLFLEQLPAGVHLVLSSRVDPPLPLAGMRARGELAELRAADLQFTIEEAAELVNGALGLGLGAEDMERLVERTEGWPAGLVLAGLSLRGRLDPGAFIAAFHGDDRHVTDLLAAEVLARQPEQVREFLLRTSVLERLSGPLCDAVLETEGSVELLGELEASSLLLVPLDDQREWYRYQQLFGELLRLELTYREALLVPVLHRRAAAWHRQAGNLEEASYHATAAGSFHAEALSTRYRQGNWSDGWSGRPRRSWPTHW